MKPGDKIGMDFEVTLTIPVPDNVDESRAPSLDVFAENSRGYLEAIIRQRLADAEGVTVVGHSVSLAEA